MSNGEDVPGDEPLLLHLRSDRRLGHEWDDWDGKPLPNGGTFEAGVGLFFALAAGAGALAVLAGAVGVWLLAPRLATLAVGLPAAAYAVLGAAALLYTLWLAGVYAALRARRNPLPVWLGEAGVLAWMMPGLERLGTALGVSRDRAGNALLRVYNGLAVARARPGVSPDELLILLPRCLGREAMRGALEVGQRYGVPLFVAPRGRHAREMIARRRPRGVVAVACERDLVSGVHDVAGRLPVLGTTLRLPEGPCRNTEVELAALERQVRTFLGLGPAPER